MTQVFTIITGVVISVMMPIAGALLVSAVIVLPASIAIRLTRSFTGVIVSGILISIFGIFSGLSMSYEFDTPPGATITCVFLMILVISLFGTMIKINSRNKVEVSESLSSRFFEDFLYFMEC